MKRYNFFQALLLAFYSKTFYRDVGQNWRGAGLAYLWFLAAICFIVFTIRLVMFVDDGLTALKPYIAQLPTITINQGDVSIDKAEPFLIKNPKNDEVVAIIDTTGQYTTLDNTTALVLLSKNKLLMQHGTTAKEYTLSDINGVFTAENVDHLLFIGYVIAVLFGLISLPFYFMLGVSQILVYAGLVSLLIRTGLAYKTLCRLTAIALTPTTLLAIIVSLGVVYLPFAWMIYIVLAIAYILFAVIANWENTTQHV